MSLRHVAALIASAFAANMAAGVACDQPFSDRLFDTSSMLSMTTEIDVGDDANPAPLGKDNISEFPLTLDPQDALLPEETDASESGAGSEAVLVEVRKESGQESRAATGAAAAKTAEVAVADDASMEPLSRENASEFPRSSDAHDASPLDAAEETAAPGSVLVEVRLADDNAPGESGAAAAAQAEAAARNETRAESLTDVKIAPHNATWTESFAAIFHKSAHEASGAGHELQTPHTKGQNFTVSSLKQNAEELLIEGLLEAMGLFLFVVAIFACVCFCTIRQAQSAARATAYNADIREQRDTGRYTHCARGTTVSKQAYLKDGKDDAEDDDDDDEETDEPADEDENSKFENDSVADTVVKEKEARLVKE